MGKLYLALARVESGQLETSTPMGISRSSLIHDGFVRVTALPFALREPIDLERAASALSC